ncbi:MAG: hypothetical protein WA956_13270 [Stenotrophomonas sp.]
MIEKIAAAGIGTETELQALVKRNDERIGEISCIRPRFTVTLASTVGRKIRGFPAKSDKYRIHSSPLTLKIKQVIEIQQLAIRQRCCTRKIHGGRHQRRAP